MLPLLQRFHGAIYDGMRWMDVVLWESSPLDRYLRPEHLADSGQGWLSPESRRTAQARWMITADEMATALL